MQDPSPMSVDGDFVVVSPQDAASAPQDAGAVPAPPFEQSVANEALSASADGTNHADPPSDLAPMSITSVGVSVEVMDTQPAPQEPSAIDGSIQERQEESGSSSTPSEAANAPADLDNNPFSALLVPVTPNQASGIANPMPNATLSSTPTRPTTDSKVTERQQGHAASTPSSLSQVHATSNTPPTRAGSAPLPPPTTTTAAAAGTAAHAAHRGPPSQSPALDQSSGRSQTSTSAGARAASMLQVGSITSIAAIFDAHPIVANRVCGSEFLRTCLNCPTKTLMQVWEKHAHASGVTDYGMLLMRQIINGFDNFCLSMISSKKDHFEKVAECLKIFDDRVRKQSQSRDQFQQGFRSLCMLFLSLVVPSRQVPFHNNIVFHFINREFGLVLWLYLKICNYFRLGRDHAIDCRELMLFVEASLYLCLDSFLKHSASPAVELSIMMRVAGCCPSLSGAITELCDAFMGDLQDLPSLLPDDFNMSEGRLRLVTLITCIRMPSTNRSKVHEVWRKFCQFLVEQHLKKEVMLRSLPCFRATGHWPFGSLIRSYCLNSSFWELMEAMLDADLICTSTDALQIYNRELLRAGDEYFPEKDSEITYFVSRVVGFCVSLDELFAWGQLLLPDRLRLSTPSSLTRSLNKQINAILAPFASRILEEAERDSDGVRQAFLRCTPEYASFTYLLRQHVFQSIISSPLQFPAALLSPAILHDNFAVWMLCAKKNPDKFIDFISTKLTTIIKSEESPSHKLSFAMFIQRVWTGVVLELKKTTISAWWTSLTTNTNFVSLAVLWPLHFPEIGLALDSIAEEELMKALPHWLEPERLYSAVRPAVISNRAAFSMETQYAAISPSLPKVYLCIGDLLAAAALDSSIRGSIFHDMPMLACDLLKREYQIQFEAGSPSLPGGYLQLSLYNRALLLLEKVAAHSLSTSPKFEILLDILPFLEGKIVDVVYCGRMNRYSETAKSLITPIQQLLERLGAEQFSALELREHGSEYRWRFARAAQVGMLAPMQLPDIAVLLDRHAEMKRQVENLVTVIKALPSLGVRCAQPPPDFCSSASLDQQQLCQLRQFYLEQLRNLQVTESTISNLYFFISRQSKLFVAYFSGPVKKGLSITDALQQVIRVFHNLQQPVLKKADLQQLYRFFSDKRNVSFSVESGIITEFLRNQYHSSGAFVATFEQFEAAMALLQLRQQLERVPQFLDKFGWYREESDKLKSLLVSLNEDITVATAVQELADFKQRAFNLQPWMAEYLGHLSECRPLLDFIAHQADFVATLGMVFDDLQGNDAALNMLHQLETVSKCARPVIDGIKAPNSRDFPEFVAAIAKLTSNLKVELITSNALQAAELSDRLGEIRGYFSRTTADAVENMIPLIKSYIENGVFKSYLARSVKGSGLVFSEVKQHHHLGPIEENTIKEAVLRDFVHGLSLYENRTDSASRGSNLDDFCQIYAAAQRIHEQRLQLESAGHPSFMTDDKNEHEIKLGIAYTMMDRMSEDAERLRRQQVEWAAAISNAQQSSPRLLFLSPKLLSSFLLSLSAGGRSAATVIPFVMECFPDYAHSEQAGEGRIAHGVSLDMVEDVLDDHPALSADAADNLALAGDLLQAVEQRLESDGVERSIKVEPSAPRVIIFDDAQPLDLFALEQELCQVEMPPPSSLTVDCALLDADLSGSYFQAVLRRMENFPRLPCILLRCERLRKSLGERLLEWLTSRADDVGSPCLVFTDKAGADMFVAFNPVQRRSTPSEQILAPLRNGVHSLSGHVERLAVVCGDAATGKTFFIEREIERMSSNGRLTSVRLAVNEEFLPTHAIDRLRALDLENTPLLCLHINASAYCNLSLLHSFLCGLVLGGQVCDQQTGSMFRLPNTVKLVLFVELTYAPMEESEELRVRSSQQSLLQALPLLRVYGKVLDYSSDPICREISAASQARVGRCYLWIQQFLDGVLSNDTLNVLIDSEPLPPQEVESIRLRFRKQLPQIMRPDSLQAVLMSSSDFALFERIFVNIAGFLHDYYAGVWKHALADRARSLAQYAELTKSLLEPASLFRRFLYEALKLSARPLAARVRSDQVIALSVRNVRTDGSPPQIDLLNLTSGDATVQFGDTRCSCIDYHQASTNSGVLRSVLGPLMGITKTEIIEELLREINYVLTVDSLVKNVLLCERRRAGENAVIVGDTGTGKTMMMRLQSRLMNANSDLFPLRLSVLRTFLVESWLTAPEMAKAKELALLARSPQVLEHAIEIALAPFMPAEEAPVLDGDEDALQGQLPFANAALPVDQAKKAAFDTLRKRLLDFFTTFFRQYPLIQLCPRLHNVVFRRRAMPPPGITPAEVAQLLPDDHPDLAPEVFDLMHVVKDYFEAQHEALFCELMMSPQVTPTIFHDHVLHVVECAKRLEAVAQQMGLKEVPMLLSFIDEFNTTPCLLGAIKEVVCDGSHNGEPLPKNIFWVTAMNPQNNSVTLNPQLSDYTGLEGNRNEFIVRPAPRGMARLQIDFGVLDAEQEKQFINNSVEMMPPPSEAAFDAHLVGLCQNFIRDARLHRVHVSLRDVIRVRKLHSFFASNSEHDGRRQGLRLLKLSRWSDLPGFDRWMPLIMSLALGYYLRLPKDKNGVQHRRHFAAMIDTELRRDPAYPGSLDKSFEDLVNSCFDGLCNKMVFPSGTARTNTIMENIFSIVTCLLIPLPLLIVGPAGCSKTLSFTIVADNMRGVDSPAEFFRTLPLLRYSRYQCSEQSTDAEIKTVYNNAIQGQQRQVNSNVVFAVFMDEAGLTPEEEMPLKAIHYELDKGEVASVLLSNKVLDAAKTNRTLQLIHDHPSDGDVQLLTTACLFESRGNMDRTERVVVDAICAGYNQIIRATNQSLFEQRDFIYFLRYIRDRLPTADLNDHMKLGEVMARSLLRNFNGSTHSTFISKVAVPFCEGVSTVNDELGSLVEYALANLGDKTVDCMRECLTDTLQEGENPNTSSIRNLMVIDPSGSAVQVMHGLGLIDANKACVIHVGAFPKDAEEAARGTVVGQVKGAMAKGETVVLLNSLAIQSSFYDVFNRHFRCLPRRDENGKETQVYFANVAIGSLSKSCIVHRDFRVIVVFPEEQLPRIPLPLRSRFAKFRLSADHLLTHRLHLRKLNNNGEDPYPQVRSNGEVVSLLNLVRDSAENMLHELHHKDCSGRLLYGLVPKETLASLFIRIDAQCPDPSVLTFPQPLHAREGSNVDVEAPLVDGEEEELPQTSSFRKLPRQVNFLLLQQARPERIFACRKFSQAYLSEFFVQQEHFSVCRFVQCLEDALANNVQHVAHKWVVESRSGSAFHGLGRNSAVLRLLVGEHAVDSTCSYQLAEIPSSKDCVAKVEQFYMNPLVTTLILVADTTRCSAACIQCVRHIVDCAEAKAKVPKMVVILVHSPPEQYFDTFCGTMFINGWDFYYVDSFGAEVHEVPHSDSSDVAVIEVADVRTWVMYACGDRSVKISVESLTLAFSDVIEAMVRRHLLTLFNGKRDHSRAPLRLTQDIYRRDCQCGKGGACACEKRDRGECLRRLLSPDGSANTFYSDLLARFVKAWKTSVLNDLVGTVCRTITEGKAVGSIELSVRVHLGHLLEPMVVDFLRKILDHYAIERIAQALHNGGAEAESMQVYLRAAVDGIELPSVGEVFSQSSPMLTGIALSAAFIPALPMFYDIYRRIAVVADQVFSSETGVGVRSLEASAKNLDSVLRRLHPDLFNLACLISTEENLRQAYFTDFVWELGHLNCGQKDQWISLLASALGTQFEGHVARSIFGASAGRSEEPAFVVCATIAGRKQCAALFQRFVAMALPFLDLDLSGQEHQAFSRLAGDLLCGQSDVSVEVQFTLKYIQLLWNRLDDVRRGDGSVEDWIAAFRMVHGRVASIAQLASEDRSYSWQYAAQCAVYHANGCLGVDAIEFIRKFPMEKCSEAETRPFDLGSLLTLIEDCLGAAGAGAQDAPKFVQSVIDRVLLGATPRLLRSSPAEQNAFVEQSARELGRMIFSRSRPLTLRNMTQSFQVQLLATLLDSAEQPMPVAINFLSMTQHTQQLLNNYRPPACVAIDNIVRGCAAEARDSVAALVGRDERSERGQALVPLDVLYYAWMSHYSKSNLGRCVENFYHYDQLAREQTSFDVTLTRIVVRSVFAAQLLRLAGESLKAEALDETPESLEAMIPVRPLNALGAVHQILTGPYLHNPAVAFLSSISSAQTLQRLLSLRPHVERLGLGAEWHIPPATGTQTVSAPTHKFQFQLPVDISDALWGENAGTLREMQALYRECEALVKASEAVVIARARAAHQLGAEAVRRLRMCLLLACYYECFDTGQACAALRNVATNELAVFLDLRPRPQELAAFAFFARGPVDVADETDSLRFLFSLQARHQRDARNLSFAAMIVNCLAVALGAPADSNHLYPRFFAINELAGTLCPGSDYMYMHKDCGFKCDPELTNSRTPPVMGNNVRARLALNSTIWIPMALSTLYDPANIAAMRASMPLMFQYANDGQFNFQGRAPAVNRPARVRTADEALREFCFHRAAGFVHVLEYLQQSVTDGLDAVHFVVESLLRLWLVSVRAGPAPAARRLFRNASEIVAYEQYLQHEVFEPTSANLARLRVPYNEVVLRGNARRALLETVLAVRTQRVQSRLGDGLVPSEELLAEYLARTMPEEEAKQGAAVNVEGDEGRNTNVVFKGQRLVRFLWCDGPGRALTVLPRAIAFLSRLQASLHLRVSRSNLSGWTVEQALAFLGDGGVDRLDFAVLCDEWSAMRQALRNTDVCPELRRRLAQGEQIEHEIALLNLSPDTLLVDVLGDIHNESESAYMKVLRELFELQGKIHNALQLALDGLDNGYASFLLAAEPSMRVNATALTFGTGVTRSLLLDGQSVWQTVLRNALFSANITAQPGIVTIDFDANRLWETLAQLLCLKSSVQWPSENPFRCREDVAPLSVNARPIADTPGVKHVSIVHALLACADALRTQRPAFHEELTVEQTNTIRGALGVKQSDDIVVASSTVLDLARAILRNGEDADDRDLAVSPALDLRRGVQELLHTVNLPLVLQKLRALKLSALGGLCRQLVFHSSDARSSLFQNLNQVLHKELEPAVAEELNGKLLSFGGGETVVGFASALLKFLKSDVVVNVARATPNKLMYQALGPIADKQKTELPHEQVRLILGDEKIFCSHLFELLQIVFAWHVRLTAPVEPETKKTVEPPYAELVPDGLLAGGAESDPVALTLDDVDPVEDAVLLADMPNMAHQPDEVMAAMAVPEPPATFEVDVSREVALQPWRPSTLPTSAVDGGVNALVQFVCSLFAAEDRLALLDSFADARHIQREAKVALCFSRLCAHALGFMPQMSPSEFRAATDQIVRTDEDGVSWFQPDALYLPVDELLNAVLSSKQLIANILSVMTEMKLQVESGGAIGLHSVPFLTITPEPNTHDLRALFDALSSEHGHKSSSGDSMLTFRLVDVPSCLLVSVNRSKVQGATSMFTKERLEFPLTPFCLCGRWYRVAAAIANVNSRLYAFVSPEANQWWKCVDDLDVQRVASVSDIEDVLFSASVLVGLRVLSEAELAALPSDAPEPETAAVASVDETVAATGQTVADVGQATSAVEPPPPPPVMRSLRVAFAGEEHRVTVALRGLASSIDDTYAALKAALQLVSIAGLDYDDDILGQVHVTREMLFVEDEPERLLTVRGERLQPIAGRVLIDSEWHPFAVFATTVSEFKAGLAAARVIVGPFQAYYVDPDLEDEIFVSSLDVLVDLSGTKQLEIKVKRDAIRGVLRIGDRDVSFELPQHPRAMTWAEATAALLQLAGMAGAAGPASGVGESGLDITFALLSPPDGSDAPLADVARLQAAATAANDAHPLRIELRVRSIPQSIVAAVRCADRKFKFTGSCGTVDELLAQMTDFARGTMVPAVALAREMLWFKPTLAGHEAAPPQRVCDAPTLQAILAVCKKHDKGFYVADFEVRTA